MKGLDEICDNSDQSSVMIVSLNRMEVAAEIINEIYVLAIIL